jgi:myo-inositol 2-dehydrogenase/D-chiro-inositol 1-dehydrogenase
MIKSCVIGLSKVGIIHCESLIKLKKTSLSYVFDKNYKLSKKLSKKFGCNTSRDFNSILKKKDIELFIIATPTTTHEFYIKKLIKFKKMIYCEKPITNNNKNLSHINSLIGKSKIKFCVGLNRRFAKEYIALKNKINKKKINYIQIISRSANHDVHLSIRNGGLFFDKGFHFFDLACWLGDSKPEKMVIISKSISTNDFLNKGDFSDAVINLKLKNGIKVEIVFSRRCRFGNLEKIEIFGEKFYLNSDNFSDRSKLYEDFSIRHRKSYFECLKKFIENKNNFLLNEAILTQKICAEALKKASISSL